MKEEGEPAFPVTDYDGIQPIYYKGATLRDYFAAHALIGFISCGNGLRIDGESPTNSGYAKAAYSISDAMLKARKE